MQFHPTTSRSRAQTRPYPAAAAASVASAANARMKALQRTTASFINVTAASAADSFYRTSTIFNTEQPDRVVYTANDSWRLGTSQNETKHIMSTRRHANWTTTIGIAGYGTLGVDTSPSTSNNLFANCDRSCGSSVAAT